MTDDPAAPARRRHAWRGDLSFAVLLAAVLSACWAVNDWAQVGVLNLPDSDDMMRLAQVRDLIAGQGFNDWTQYRLGPPGGAPMHWSRIADLGPAAIILAAAPFAGRATAELSAVLLWPAILFAAYLLLSARIARRIGPAAGAPIAIVLAAIAYPANSLFLPGRIDHHGLQIVLILGAVLALARPPSARGGAMAGALAAVSFGIGLETAPQVAALVTALLALWAIRGKEEAGRVIGFGAALVAGTATLLAVARPHYWSAAWCDAFTPAAATAALAAGAVFIATGVVSGWIRTPWARLATGGTLGVSALGATLAAYPVCLTGPYGPMDPFVRHALIDNIVEAGGLFAGPPAQFVGTGLPSAGLIAVATIVAAILWRRHPSRRAALLPAAATLVFSDLVVLAQLRGAYVGSALAAPILAQLILAARARAHARLPALAGAWAVSAGMLWLLVPQRIEAAMAPAGENGAAATRSCRAGDVWRQLDRLPPGVVMASAANSAYVIGGTRHRSVGAGYHRNNAGNVAMYAFFLSPPDRARAIARGWGVTYVVACATDFAEIDVGERYPASLAATLQAGRVPRWLAPVPLRDTGLRLYRLTDRGRDRPNGGDDHDGRQRHDPARRPALVADAAVRADRRARHRDPAADAGHRAAGRPAGPYGPLSRPAGSPPGGVAGRLV